ncbi:transcriptional regulator [Gordonibacter sp. An230]|uniref:helix-turn-helix transcriptional regulator n=1 Tax=Gordonibacter sp. An230 TaxID=1965592 RepID=UPI000B372763|nr:helix-turn-helix transcriptional regulator [Gordonibacter sp. An230]OUO90191.1 transcriptional regulator [Gordonibacter sp. An230]
MVGDKLVKLRKKQGMSQQQVASVLGVTRQTVSNWECGQGAPALDKAGELARLYGVSLDDLVADAVAVMTADSVVDAEPRDLHVLKLLEGRRCRICYRRSDMVDIMKSSSLPDKARVLGVTDDWMRVGHDLGTGNPWSKKEAAISLIDVNLVDSVLVWPIDDDAAAPTPKGAEA